MTCIAYTARASVWWIVMVVRWTVWTVWTIVVVMMVVVIVRMVVRIAPTPIVRVVPTIVPARIPVVIVWIIAVVSISIRRTPAIIPAIGWHNRCTPRTEHRGYILWLHPNHIARHHNVVERRVVRRGVVKRIRVLQRIVRRRHTIGRRREAIETTSIGTLVRICQHRIVDIYIALRYGHALLCSLRLNLGKVRLILRLLSLVLRLRKLSLSLLAVSNRYLVVYRIEVVGIGHISPRSGASRHREHHCRSGHYCKNLSHSFFAFIYITEKRVRLV